MIPAQHRILWVNSVDLVWNAILSSAAQRSSVFEEVDDEEEEVSGLNIGSREFVVAVDQSDVSTAAVDEVEHDKFIDQFNTTTSSGVLVAT